MNGRQCMTMLVVWLLMGSTLPAQTLKEYMDSLHHSYRIEYLGKDSLPDSVSLRRMVDRFYYDQFIHAYDPRTPYFMFVSSDADFAMGIGGVVRMQVWEDWGRVIPTNGFTPYHIPVSASSFSKRMGATPSGTVLYFRMLGRNRLWGEYQLYVEGKFNGYKGVGFRLKKSYVTIRDWTVGYARSTFSDPKSVPVQVDDQGPNAFINHTTLLVRWMHQWHPHWVTAASVEVPYVQDRVEARYTSVVPTWLPSFALFGQYEWDTDQYIRLSGIVRTFTYQDKQEQCFRDVVGWGLQLSGVYDPLPFMRLYGAVNYGHGIAGLLGDLKEGYFDLMDDPSRPGRMTVSRTWGGYVGTQVQLHRRLRLGGVVGALQLLPSVSVQPTCYRCGYYGAVNLYGDLSPRIQLAVEYTLGARQNWSRTRAWAQRMSVLMQLSF